MIENSQGKDVGFGFVLILSFYMKNIKWISNWTILSFGLQKEAGWRECRQIMWGKNKRKNSVKLQE